MTTGRDLTFSLGDLIRALHVLAPTAAEAQVIARLLGIASKDLAAQAVHKIPPTDHDARPIGTSLRRAAGVAPRLENKQGKDAGARFKPSPALGRLKRERLPATDATYPAWMPNQGIPLQAPNPPSKTGRPGLFAARTTRGLLQAILSTRVSTDELDVARLVDTLAERRSVVDLPRLTAWSLRRGVQVLVDQGDGMLPFALDAEDLVARLRGTASSDLIQLRYFRGDPSFMLSEASFEPLPYAPPTTGTPVLMISDLGIGRRTSKSFSRFARRLRKLGYTFTAIVPYPSRRWPAGLEKLMTIVQWDRRTDLRAIRITRTRQG